MRSITTEDVCNDQDDCGDCSDGFRCCKQKHRLEMPIHRPLRFLWRNLQWSARLMETEDLSDEDGDPNLCNSLTRKRGQRLQIQINWHLHWWWNQLPRWTGRKHTQLCQWRPWCVKSRTTNSSDINQQADFNYSNSMTVMDIQTAQLDQMKTGCLFFTTF